MSDMTLDIATARALETDADRQAFRDAAVALFRQGQARTLIAAASATYADDKHGAFTKQLDENGKRTVPATFTRGSYAALFGRSETSTDLWRALGIVLAECRGFDPEGKHAALWADLSGKALALRQPVRDLIGKLDDGKRVARSGDAALPALTITALRDAVAGVATSGSPQKTADEKRAEQAEQDRQAVQRVVSAPSHAATVANLMALIAPHVPSLTADEWTTLDEAWQTMSEQVGTMPSEQDDAEQDESEQDESAA